MMMMMMMMMMRDLLPSSQGTGAPTDWGLVFSG